MPTRAEIDARHAVVRDRLLNALAVVGSEGLATQQLARQCALSATPGPAPASPPRGGRPGMEPPAAVAALQEHRAPAARLVFAAEAESRWLSSSTSCAASCSGKIAAPDGQSRRSTRPRIGCATSPTAASGASTPGRAERRVGPTNCRAGRFISWRSGERSSGCPLSRSSRTATAAQSACGRS